MSWPGELVGSRQHEIGHKKFTLPASVLLSARGGDAAISKYEDAAGISSVQAPVHNHRKSGTASRDPAGFTIRDARPHWQSGARLQRTASPPRACRAAGRRASVTLTPPVKVRIDRGYGGRGYWTHTAASGPIWKAKNASMRVALGPTHASLRNVRQTINGAGSCQRSSKSSKLSSIFMSRATAIRR